MRRPTTPLLGRGGLSRLLGVHSPVFPHSSSVSLLCRRPGASFSRFPPLPAHRGGHLHAGPHPRHDSSHLDYIFSSMPLYERSGFYSCPQTPIHCVPPAMFPQPPSTVFPLRWSSHLGLQHQLPGPSDGGLWRSATPGSYTPSAFPWLS